MSESRLLKARCKKTGRFYALELKKYGSEWKVVNLVNLSEEEYRTLPSEVKQAKFFSADNLRPCTACGSRQIGGCACPNGGDCSPHMKFKLDCLYCNQLVLDYSAPVRSPYNVWAGTSNIPDATKDRYGNPQGSQYDLARDGAFIGFTVVILNLAASSRKISLDDPIAALEKKGFEVVEYRRTPPYNELKELLSKDKVQLWIISDKYKCLDSATYKLIEDFFKTGHGVYFMGEEEPYFTDVNPIIGKLFSSSMHGNNRGGRVLYIQTADGEPGIIPNHYITTGIVSFYEGTTIATVDVAGGLEPLIFSSNKQIVAAYYEKNGCRAIVDGGYTRLYCQWDTAGTDRYVVNAAAWLANFERFGY